MNEKKKLTLCFNRKIQKQKLALDVLMYEHDQTGLPFMYIIHEALVVYAKSKGYINRQGEPSWKKATPECMEPENLEKDTADVSALKAKAGDNTGTGNCIKGAGDGISTGYCSPDIGMYAADNYSDLINE